MPQVKRYRFGKHQRVLRSQEFTRTLRMGTCAADATLVLFAIAAATSQSPRIGVTIPKKMGNAVVRNKWKRLIREAFRTRQDQIPAGYDYIVRPKKGAEPRWDRIEESISTLSRKAVKRERAS